MSRPKKLLFISHDSSRTGAPMLLLNFIKWIANNQKGVKITILLVKNGDLKQEFQKYGKTYVLADYGYVSNPLLKLKNKFVRDYILFSKKWDLIFSNTIVNGKVLDKFQNLDIPIVTYVHELKDTIEKYSKRGMVSGSLENSDYFFCGSQLVRDVLTSHFDIPHLKSSVVHSFIDFKEYSFEKDKNISKNLKKDLNINTSTLVVGMMGRFDKRKGNDLFIKVAEKLENVHFVWVGADKKRLDNFLVSNKISSSNISLIAPSPEYLEYYNIIDILFLSSREDPYPMIMVEASAYGMPIICFKDTGGTQEFIDDKTGVVVDFNDIDSVIKAIESYDKKRELITGNIDYIKNKSFGTHDVSINAEIIFNKIKELY